LPISAERWDAREQHVQDHTKTPNIGGFAVCSVTLGFGSFECIKTFAITRKCNDSFMVLAKLGVSEFFKKYAPLKI
jgi:hypothetical protein